MRQDHGLLLRHQTIPSKLIDRILPLPPAVVLQYHVQVVRMQKSCNDVDQKILADLVQHSLNNNYNKIFRKVQKLENLLKSTLTNNIFTYNQLSIGKKSIIYEY